MHLHSRKRSPERGGPCPGSHSRSGPKLNPITPQGPVPGPGSQPCFAPPVCPWISASLSVSLSVTVHLSLWVSLPLWGLSLSLWLSRSSRLSLSLSFSASLHISVSLSLSSSLPFCVSVSAVSSSLSLCVHPFVWLVGPSECPSRFPPGSSIPSVCVSLPVSTWLLSISPRPVTIPLSLSPPSPPRTC